MYCPKLYVDYRSPQISQDKAQFAGNGASLVKNCNAGLGDLGASLRARRETAICCVAYTDVGEEREQDAGSFVILEPRFRS